ncbi:nucleotidyltransferase [Halalkalibaculum sp. DA3122]|uniref:nucleotidyltransferase n=1 Tax=unclassified Halalkalibaculum TaxID=2964617 RepID=UPI0037543583
MRAEYFSPDTQQFLVLLDKYEVKYLIVGGEAVIYYGYPRLTGDVDFFYSSDSDNVVLLFDALLEFWDNDIPGLTKPEELQSPGYVIQFGVPPNRIDLINDIEGVRFDEAWEGRVTESISIKDNNIPVYIIGLSDLITNKRQAGRNKDLEDLNYLESID